MQFFLPYGEGAVVHMPEVGEEEGRRRRGFVCAERGGIPFVIADGRALWRFSR